MGQSASNPAAAAPQAVVEVAETDREEELRRQRHQEEVMRLQRVVEIYTSTLKQWQDAQMLQQLRDALRRSEADIVFLSVGCACLTGR
jgi:hypothetical protein